MKRLNVQTLNECLGIDGPEWIEDNPDNYIEGVPCQPPTAFKQGHQTNKGRPTSELQKITARKSLLKRYKNGLDVSGANNPRAKTWRIVFIDGRELVIKSIHDWAKENGYSKAAIRNVHIRKWTKTKDIISVEVFNDNLKSSKQIVSEYEEKTSNPNWGKMSDEVKNKLSKERMGTNNKSSKWWKITFDDGRIIERCGLDNWCKENGYDRRSLSRVKNKQHKKHKDIVAVEEVSQDAL